MTLDDDIVVAYLTDPNGSLFGPVQAEAGELTTGAWGPVPGAFWAGA